VNSNIVFTDFLSDQDYGRLLKESDLICVFTDRDHTMLRGAYEAIYLGKPVVLSSWDILKKNFPIGAVHVSNTVDGISNGIIQAMENIKVLTEEAIALRMSKLSIWNKNKKDILNIINNS
jgi:glycosyltransferase involved in cell wall biosynthesis